MKKNYTDSDIKKMLKELARFVPEVDVNDTEWGAFLREFIAARPTEKLDKAVAQEIRCRILQRSEELHQQKQSRIPRWLKFTAPVALGAAVCAVVIVPMLQKPDMVLMKESSAPVLHNRIASRSVPIVEKEVQMPLSQDRAVLVVQEIEQIFPVSEPEEVVITPQMLEREEEVPAPDPEEENQPAEGDRAFLDEPPVPEAMMYMSEPVVEVPEPEEVVVTPKMVLSSEESNAPEPEGVAQLDSLFPEETGGGDTMMAAPASAMGGISVVVQKSASVSSLPQLRWEDVPSDAEILRVATEFFRQHNFDSLGDVMPQIDKWWDNGEEMDWKPEFAPERVGVVFAMGNGLEDIRIDVETRTLRVVWMTYSQSNR